MKKQINDGTGMRISNARPVTLQFGAATMAKYGLRTGTKYHVQIDSETVDKFMVLTPANEGNTLSPLTDNKPGGRLSVTVPGIDLFGPEDARFDVDGNGVITVRRPRMDQPFKPRPKPYGMDKKPSPPVTVAVAKHNNGITARSVARDAVLRDCQRILTFMGDGDRLIIRTTDDGYTWTLRPREV